MLVFKIIIYTCIFLTTSAIGILKSKKYVDRVNELKELKNALTIFKTKIKFTYEPIPEIFTQISTSMNSNIGNIFKVAGRNMQFVTAGVAWENAVDTQELNINNEDKLILKNLSNLLGKTNLEGQLCQIEVANNFLDRQISKAEKEREKNEHMYRVLGAIIGLTIVVVLM